MNPVIIIQARMNSSRFPGKVLADLEGKAVIDRVVERCERSGFPTIIALSREDMSSLLLEHVLNHDYLWCMPDVPENDVLKRYVHMAERYRADPIVRITADCPLVDPATITAMVEAYARTPGWYVGNWDDPDGNDVEVCSMSALTVADEQTPDEERQHVLTWVRRQPQARRIRSGLDLGDVKYSIDTPEDLEMCARCIRAGCSTWNEIVLEIRRQHAHEHF